MLNTNVCGFWTGVDESYMWLILHCHHSAAVLRDFSLQRAVSVLTKCSSFVADERQFLLLLLLLLLSLILILLLLLVIVLVLLICHPTYLGRPLCFDRQFFCFYFDSTCTSNLRDAPSKVYQWSVLGVARKIHSDISPIPPLVFVWGRWVKKCEIWPGVWMVVSSAFSGGPYLYSMLYLLSTLYLSKRPLKQSLSLLTPRHMSTTLLLNKFCRNWVLRLLFAGFKQFNATYAVYKQNTQKQLKV